MKPTQSEINATTASSTLPAMPLKIENNQGSVGTLTVQSGGASEDKRKNLHRTVPERTTPEPYHSSTVQHTAQTASGRSMGPGRGALDSPSSPPKGLTAQSERTLCGSPDDTTLRQRRGGVASTGKSSRRSSRSVSPSSDSDSRGSKKKSRIKGKGKGGVVKGKVSSKVPVKGKSGAGLKSNEGNAQASLLAPVTPAGMAHWFVNISSNALGYLEKQLMDTDENSNGDVREGSAISRADIGDAHSSTGKVQSPGQGLSVGAGVGHDLRGEKVRGVPDKMEGVGRIHVSLVSVFKALVTDAAEGDHYVVRYTHIHIRRGIYVA